MCVCVCVLWQEIQKIQEDFMAKGGQKVSVKSEPDSTHLQSPQHPYSYCNGVCANVSLAVVVVLFGFLVHTVVQSVS